MSEELRHHHTSTHNYFVLLLFISWDPFDYHLYSRSLSTI